MQNCKIQKDDFAVIFARKHVFLCLPRMMPKSIVKGFHVHDEQVWHVHDFSFIISFSFSLFLSHFSLFLLLSEISDLLDTSALYSTSVMSILRSEWLARDVCTCYHALIEPVLFVCFFANKYKYYIIYEIPYIYIFVYYVRNKHVYSYIL